MFAAIVDHLYVYAGGYMFLALAEEVRFGRGCFAHIQLTPPTRMRSREERLHRIDVLPCNPPCRGSPYRVRWQSLLSHVA